MKERGLRSPWGPSADEAPEVVLESTYGWYWAADVLKELGASVHLTHPLGNNWGTDG